MSGFVGMVNRDGAPVDRTVLRQMTDFLSFRGPDAQEIWTAGPVGFGHALFRTTFESGQEHQPRSLEGQTWIVAQARVDARDELIRELRVKGRNCSGADPDVELILHAYAVWGEDCIHHVIGDFGFAIWDEQRNRLFCARDHFGVKPFYYALVPSGLVFSNTLDCLRLHPEVSGRLNDLAIADFLLIGTNNEPDTTTFADIRRLPPAHTLTWSDRALQIRRYWEMPVEEPLQFRRPANYIEQFRELLSQAVSDRLRTSRVGVNMSGGLDSSTVAATANKLLRNGPEHRGVCAFTLVFNRVPEDRERYFSGLVGQHCGFPLCYIVGDSDPLFAGQDRPEMQTPEPYEGSMGTVMFRRFHEAASFSRVLLTGEGGDPGMVPSLAYFRGKRLPSLFWGVARYASAHRRLPPLGFRLAFNRWREIPRQPTSYPVWFNPAFENECRIQERWVEINREQPSIHPDRPAAHRALTRPFWPALFESYDSSVTGVPLDVRHALFDLRLQRFLLRLPVLPWCADKHLFRMAMREALPEEVLQRRKAPFLGEPLAGRLHNEESRWIDEFEPSPELAHFVARDRIPRVTGLASAGPLARDVNLRPIALNFWLKYGYPFMYRYGAKEGDGERTRTVGQQESL